MHGIPNRRPLVEGDIVSIDTGRRLNGWCGDAAVTLPIGPISPDRQRLLDVTKETSSCSRSGPWSAARSGPRSPRSWSVTSRARAWP
ncbi:MAG: M24 family metallopeptidase [Isosphaeraceae bacterium]